jgi:hypothetical protein
MKKFNTINNFGGWNLAQLYTYENNALTITKETVHNVLNTMPSCSLYNRVKKYPLSAVTNPYLNSEEGYG